MSHTKIMSYSTIKSKVHRERFRRRLKFAYAVVERQYNLATVTKYKSEVLFGLRSAIIEFIEYKNKHDSEARVVDDWMFNAIQRAEKELKTGCDCSFGAESEERTRNKWGEVDFKIFGNIERMARIGTMEDSIECLSIVNRAYQSLADWTKLYDKHRESIISRYNTLQQFKSDARLHLAYDHQFQDASGTVNQIHREATSKELKDLFSHSTREYKKKLEHAMMEMNKLCEKIETAAGAGNDLDRKDKKKKKLGLVGRLGRRVENGLDRKGKQKEK